MRIKSRPEDFCVEEQIALPGTGSGRYTYYRVEKRGCTTLRVRDALAARLEISPSRVAFPALKDKQAVAVQYASVPRTGPARLEGRGFTAEAVAQGPRDLRPGDLRGNRFVLVVRDLGREEGEVLRTAFAALAEGGLPNYFDRQRFGSYSPQGFIGKAILKRDAEQAVRIYLAVPMAGDPREIRKFKRLAAAHWGEWGYLLHEAPRPSNLRSVLTYLKDHPQDFRKALNLIKDRLLSIYLVAYQSWIWNRIVGQYFEGEIGAEACLEIATVRLALPSTPPEDVVTLPLPNLTAQYPPAVRPYVEAVLSAEGLTLEDFKARILRRVYLPKSERDLWFAPAGATAGALVPDSVHEGRWACTLAFTLEPGQYATLVLKAVAAHAGRGVSDLEGG